MLRMNNRIAKAREDSKALKAEISKSLPDHLDLLQKVSLSFLSLSE